MTTPAMRFGHFGINCFDIKAMEDFYTRVMGMVVADRGYVPQA
jgi:catechol 2,3-dioxygenase-like lactoylglutathione lyase family enzyme